MYSVAKSLRAATDSEISFYIWAHRIRTILYQPRPPACTTARPITAIGQAEFNPGNCTAWFIRCSCVTTLISCLTNMMTLAYDIPSPSRPSLRPSCSRTVSKPLNVSLFFTIL